MVDDFVMLPADSLVEGMLLDLEGDEFATMISPEANEQERQDHELTVSAFEFEYAMVDAVVRETLTCVVVHTETVSFACPPKHKIKVANLIQGD